MSKLFFHRAYLCAEPISRSQCNSLFSVNESNWASNLLRRSFVTWSRAMAASFVELVTGKLFALKFAEVITSGKKWEYATSLPACLTAH
jgi:hypothetical protein